MIIDSYWKSGKIRKESDVSSNSENICKNPLLKIPFEIRMDLEASYFETGKTSLSQRYFTEQAEKYDIMPDIQKMYFYAVRNNNHKLAWNLIVMLSQIQYKLLGNTAAILAMSATRNPYKDVVEMGIRCYENWEDKIACEFLKQSVFEEEWLQEYADEVCSYVMEEGESNVLFEKNHTWEMADNQYTTSNAGRYRGGYSSSRISNG